MRATIHLKHTAAPSLVVAWLYIRRELLFLAWALMEAALLAPFFLLWMPWTRAWSPLLFTGFLLFLMLIPFNLGRLFSLLGLPLGRQRRLLIMGALVAFTISLRLMLYPGYGLFDLGWAGALFRRFMDIEDFRWRYDVILFFAITIVWGRGISLLNRSVDINDVGLRLRLGALILAPILIAIAEPFLPWPVTPFVLLFFLSSLVAIALVRAEQIELERTGRAFPMSPRWIGVIALTSAAIVVMAGLATSLASDGAIASVARWLAPLWRAIEFAFASFIAVVGYLATPLLIVLEWLVRLLARWLANIPFELAPARPIGPEGQDPFRLLEEMAREAGPLSRLPVILLGALLLLLTVLALERLYRRSRGAADQAVRRAPPRERTEPLARLSLSERLRRRLARLQRWRAAASVRRIYQHMCQAAAVYGYARESAQTPYEYLRTLDKAWPEGGADTRLITNAYVRVRYGEAPESRAELDEIQAAWQRLEAMPPVGAG